MNPLSGFNVNDVIQIRQYVRNTDLTWQGMNVFNYRVLVGESPWTAEVAGDVFTKFHDDVSVPWASMLSSDMTIFDWKLQIHRFGASPSVVWEPAEPADNVAGGITLGIAEYDSFDAAACMVRKSFRTGRTAIGRLFFGPLADRFRLGNVLVVDPTGTGDLNDITSAAFLEHVFDAGAPGNSVTLRPCIVGFTMTDGERRLKRAAAALDDVRIQEFSPLLSNLHSRRQGVGM